MSITATFDQQVVKVIKQQKKLHTGQDKEKWEEEKQLSLVIGDVKTEQIVDTH